MLHKLLFPELLGRWVKINLNDWAVLCFDHAKCFGFPNPLINPDYCALWIDSIHEKINCDYSFGGYMENRDTLWYDHYMKDHHHFGIDFNVPAGTPVHAPKYSVLFDSKIDEIDQNGGWGGKVTLWSPDGKMLLYAHLDPTRINIQKEYEAGDIIGYVGRPEHNGGWYPHLHVQSINMPYVTENNIEIDGYGPNNKMWRRAFPDPENPIGDNS